MKPLALAFAAALSAAAVPAHATFILDTTCGVSSCAAGTKFFIGSANADVSTFTGTVGGQHAGPSVTVSTVGNVDTGAGFATIKPTAGATLTSLTFTPADDTLFNDFSFRGQLAAAGFNGTIDVSVTDSSGTVSSIVFTGVAGPNTDFNRLGVVSLDGETIKSVLVSTTSGGSFKEFKQIEFSFLHPIPEPASIAVFALGLTGVAFALRRRKQAG
jgi:hypothetical protein